MNIEFNVNISLDLDPDQADAMFEKFTSEMVKEFIKEKVAEEMHGRFTIEWDEGHYTAKMLEESEDRGEEDFDREGYCEGNYCVVDSESIEDIIING